MQIALQDDEIRSLIAVKKLLPTGYRTQLSLQHRQGDPEKRASLEIQTDAGERFSIKLRQAVEDHFDFSAILAYDLPGCTRTFRLRRYNGQHEHTNHIEREQFDSTHIHEATARYQAAGYKEEGYAKACDRYVDLHGALECLINDCGFIRPEGEQPSLW